MTLLKHLGIAKNYESKLDECFPSKYPNLEELQFASPAKITLKFQKKSSEEVWRGSVQWQGTVWSAKGSDDRLAGIPVGDFVKVVSRDGIRLNVETLEAVSSDKIQNTND